KGRRVSVGAWLFLSEARRLARMIVRSDQTAEKEARVLPLGQGSDLKLARHRVETLAQRFRHRNAMGTAIDPFGVALLAGKPDAVDAGQALRLTDIADETVHRFFELNRRHESLDRQRHDRLAGIGRLAGFFD